jgi:hypothetical protein
MAIEPGKQPISMEKILIVLIQIKHQGHQLFALLAIDEPTQLCITRVVNSEFGSL